MVLLLSKAAGFTLSLPGIAGLIVAVGITADSFIVYFERIRDEMRDGRSMRVAVADRLEARPEHLPGGRRRLAAGGRRALHLRRRRGEGLRVRARSLHGHRPRGLLLVHPPDGDAAGAVPRSSTAGHKLSGLDREALGIDTHPRGRARPDGQVLRVSATTSTTGRKSIDFVGRKWLWYAISGVIVLLAVAGLWFKGLNYRHRVHRRRRSTASTCPRARSPRPTPTSCARRSPAPASTRPPSPDRHHLRRQADPRPDRAAHRRARAPRSSTRSSQVTGVDPQKSISQTEIGASWGKEVAKRSLHRPRGLPRARDAVHLGLLPRVEDVGRRDRGAGPRRPHHDRRSTRSSGFEVTPATVTGVLTILGFSLYDTVVVFDKVRENTKRLRERRTTYAGAGQPRRQPDAGALDQHLDRGADPGRRDPLRRRRPAGQRLAQGPRAGAVRRHGRRCLLVDLHRDAAAGAAEVGRERGQAGREAGRRAPPRGGPLRRGAGVHRGHAGPGRAHR